MKKLGLINSNKKGRTCNYTLTDDGRIVFSIIANFKGNEEFKKNAIKGIKLISFS